MQVPRSSLSEIMLVDLELQDGRMPTKSTFLSYSLAVKILV